MDKLTTVEELDGAIREMYTGITSFMTNTVLDNLSAYDLSFLIDNAGMESLDGWECAQADVLLFTNGLCNTSSTFDMYQTLKQMPKGVYRVGYRDLNVRAPIPKSVRIMFPALTTWPQLFIYITSLPRLTISWQEDKRKVGNGFPGLDAGLVYS